MILLFSLFENHSVVHEDNIWLNYHFLNILNFVPIDSIPQLQRGRTPINEYPDYDTKQSVGEAPAMLVRIGSIW